MLYEITIKNELKYMLDPNIIISPIMVSGIIGTTLSLAVFSIFQNSKFSKWMSPKYFDLFAATSFIMSYFFTISYIVIINEYLLWISLFFLIVAGIFLFISILYLYKSHIVEDVLNQIKDTPQLNELFSNK